MSFHLTRAEPLPHQLRNVVRSELAAALEALRPRTPDAEGIHEARKSVKKIRAVLRLVRSRLGADYERDNETLRIATRSLSALRDADVSAGTLRRLRGQYANVLPKEVAEAVAAGLRRRRRRMRARSGVLLGTARTELGRAAASIPDHVARAGDLRTVRAGARRCYGRVRRELRELRLDSGTARFHLWRRRLKDHCYQLRLFEELHFTPRARADALNRLEEWLGEDHNLAILRGILLDAPGRYGSAGDTTLVLGCITKRQATLRRKAIALGRRMFADRPQDFERAVRVWWRGNRGLGD